MDKKNKKMINLIASLFLLVDKCIKLLNKLIKMSFEDDETASLRLNLGSVEVDLLTLKKKLKDTKEERKQKERETHLLKTKLNLLKNEEEKVTNPINFIT